VRLALAILPLYFRHFPIQRGKTAVWERIVVRHLIWREVRLSATSPFGARFEVCFPDVLQAYLYFFGVWEPVITRHLLDQLREGDVFIDVGANIGYYALLASRRVGANGRVFAIEAASGTYAKLQQNLLQNKAVNVTTFHVAVSDASGRVPVWLHRDGELAGATTLSYVAERRRAMKIVETVEARPLQEIVDVEILRKARFIKIDVEGAEWAVVKSLGELLKTVSSRTEIIVEVNEALVQRSGGTIEEFLGYFAAAGFTPFVIPNRYDVKFLGTKVSRADLRPLERWKGRQADLVFRRTGAKEDMRPNDMSDTAPK
jgi:FkbM family methyltransferase